MNKAKLIAGFVVCLLWQGLGWIFVYHAALRDLLNGGFVELVKLLGRFEVTSIVWWRDFIWYFWPIVIVLFSLFATSCVIAVLAIEMRYGRLLHESEEEQYVMVYDRFQRAQYYLLYVLFFIVAFTGFIMFFGNNPLVRYLYASRELYVVLHIVAGVLLGALAIFHVGHYGARFFVSLRKLGWKGTMERFPMLRAFRPEEMLTNLGRLYRLAFNPKGPSPEWDKYGLESLLHYWGEYFGMVVIGVTGVVMIFYGAYAWTGFAWAFHVREAMLAVAIWLLLILPLAHFRPLKFPVDKAFLTGKLPLSEVRREHPLWYRRLVSRGEE